MPIYEYVCLNCAAQFENLALSVSEPDPACPECGGASVEKLMSAASIRSQGIPSGSGGFTAPSCKPSG